jgi:hypothetical protein
MAPLSEGDASKPILGTSRKAIDAMMSLAFLLWDGLFAHPVAKPSAPIRNPFRSVPLEFSLFLRETKGLLVRSARVHCGVCANRYGQSTSFSSA